MFERPTKNDLDRSLSLLMHDSRHMLAEKCNHIKSEAAKVGALQSNRVVVTAVKAADDLHKATMTQATTILLDFIERMERPPAEIVGWARPHLENLSNSLLGVVPPNNFPQDYQRLTHQYRTVFQQRLDGVLRDVEIGFVKGAGFARAEKVESKEEWASAAEAIQLLKLVFDSTYEAQMIICKRAHNGMIRARAQRFLLDGRKRDNFEIPKEFWWAEGHQALNQNWTAGDFDTWIDNGSHHLEAFGVSFLRADIDTMIPASASTTQMPAAQAAASPTPGGRKPADWWEDCLLEVAFQHFRGDLKPKAQADIARAMHAWITEHGFRAADSTVKIRARKLWDKIKREADN
jgi:hypothetical protein